MAETSVASKIASSRLSRHGGTSARPLDVIDESRALDVIESLKKIELPDALRTKMGHKADLLIAKLSSAADQLKAVGGVVENLTAAFMQNERANEHELAMLPYEVTRLASEAGKAYEMGLHDPLTLLKSKTLPDASPAKFVARLKYNKGAQVGLDMLLKLIGT